MLCLSQKRIVVTKDRPHGPGHSVPMLIVVEREDHSAIQASPNCLGLTYNVKILEWLTQYFYLSSFQFYRPAIKLLRFSGHSGGRFIHAPRLVEVAPIIEHASASMKAKEDRVPDSTSRSSLAIQAHVPQVN